VSGASAVSLAVVSGTGTNARTVSALRALHGVIRFRYDLADYLTVVVRAEDVIRVASLSSVEAVTVDRIVGGDPFPFESARDELLPGTVSEPKVPAPSSRWAQAATEHLLDQPYPFLKDVGAQNFREAHPEYDGRGVVVAHIESLPDLLMPELQTALDVQGREILKFKDVINLPDEEATFGAVPRPAGPNAWQWVMLSAPVRANDGIVEVDGKRYSVPAGHGIYRIGELRLPPALLGKLRLPGRESNAKDATFAVLWSESDRAAWIDSDGAGHFEPQRAVREFRLHGDVGVLGEDDPATPRRESVGFVVQKNDPYLSITFGDGDHASMVAGDVAARRGTRGRLDGIAPGAQLLSIYQGRTASTFARAFIRAFESPADIVLIEGYFPVLGDNERRDGHSALEILLQRLIARTDKPCLVTGNNTPGFATVIDLAPPSALVIGAAQTRGATYAHYGLVMRKDADLHWVGSEGPTGIGDLKPDLLAPVNELALGTALDPGYEHKGLFTLPPGYQIGGGTSSATPIAAGAVALLVSGARSKGLPHGALAIKRAMQDGARFLPDVQAHQQGAGLLQVDAAWRQLQTQSTEPQLARIAVEAPVHTMTSALLPTPNLGVGLLEREGWHIGDVGTRIVRFVRHGGQAAFRAFDVQWVGNESQVFTAPDRIELPREQPAELAVTIAPRAAGAQSAILELRDPSSHGVVQRVLCTVVVSEPLAAENGFVSDQRVSIDRPGRRSFFFDVPPESDALSVTVEHSGGLMFGSLHSPENVQEPGYLLVDPATGKLSASVQAPRPGAWQLVFIDGTDRLEFQNDGAVESPAPTSVRVRAAVSAARISARNALTVSENVTAFEVDAENHAGRILGGLVSSAGGQARYINGVIRSGEQRVIDLSVQPGARWLMAQFNADSTSSSADLDLYLFDCTRGHCIDTPYRRSRTLLNDERVMVSEPRPGTWKVVIDALSAGLGSTTFAYLDVVSDPRIGGFSSADASIVRRPGDSWTTSGLSWWKQPLETDREPVALLYVADPQLKQQVLMRPSQHWWLAVDAEEEDVPLGLVVLPLRSSSAHAATLRQ
jgi:hypothetical protein